MANVKISELNELTQKALDDYLPIVDTSADETKKISIENLVPTEIPNIENTYSESTSDAYSCNYINNSDSYSTSEVKTNKRWIDNKPIYRKNLTVDTGTTLDLWSSIAHNINNVDFIMIINAFFANGNGDKEMLPNSDIQVAINNTNIRLVLKSASMKNRNMTLIVEYTKTTDV